MFSVYTNADGLFKVRQTSNPLECLNGVRILSMLWFELFHIVTAYEYGPLFNGKSFIEVHKIKDT